MGFGILNGISIGLLNLSLGFNSVGFYQVEFFCTFLFILLFVHYYCFLADLQYRKIVNSENSNGSGLKLFLVVCS